MKTKAILSVFCLLSAYCLLNTAHCLAAVPSLINYQGVLKDSTGVPQNGGFKMEFSIYNDSTGGNLLWGETQDPVQVKNGLFNVLLGTDNPIPDSVFKEPDRWLQVKVENTVLMPRRQIVSVGYAYKAYRADMNCEDCDDRFVNTTGPDSITVTSTSDYALTVSSSNSAGDALGAFFIAVGSASGAGIPIWTYSSGGTAAHGIWTDADNANNPAWGGMFYGDVASGSGVGTGVSANGYGAEENGYGVRGSGGSMNGDGYGVEGYGTSMYGGDAYGGYFTTSNLGTGTHYGIYATAKGGSATYAGYFEGKVVAESLVVLGAKSAAVKINDGDYHLLYCQESPENWFEDFGKGQLTNGRAIVTIDPLFTQTVNTSVDYHVFLTPKGDCNGLYIASQTLTSFEVRELQSGNSDISFSYRIVAKRKGYENIRLPKMGGPSPEEIAGKQALNREKRGKERAEMEEEHQRIMEERKRRQ